MDQVIQTRIAGLERWLDENALAPNEQAHLDEGSPERAYWHRGYLQALRDLQELLAGPRGAAN